MAVQIIETKKQPIIEIENCNGDLEIRPWMELAVRASGEYEFENKEGDLLFKSSEDLRLDIPEGSNLKIGTISGDLVVKNINGEISINNVLGDAVLTNLNLVKINEVHGDLSAKSLQGPIYVELIDGDVLLRNIGNDVSIAQINGDLAGYFINGAVSLKQVTGDVSLRTINGDIDIDLIRRDVNLRNLGGVCNIKKTLGDIRLMGGLAAGKHEFAAGGDIVVRWPVHAPIDLLAQGAEIKNKLPLMDVKDMESGFSGHIGDGETVVQLTAGGKILLKEAQLIDEKWNSGSDESFGMDFMVDLAGIGERVSAEVNHHLSKMTNQLENHFGPEFAQNISNKVTQQAERAARQAERAADKARKFAEREATRADRWNQATSSSKPHPSPPKPEPTPNKTSTEEQLKILKMVENGTITPEDATILLEALEG